jgi:hypothetical protein
MISEYGSRTQEERESIFVKNRCGTMQRNLRAASISVPFLLAGRATEHGSCAEFGVAPGQEFGKGGKVASMSELEIVARAVELKFLS